MNGETTYFSLKPCGCLAWAMLDNAEQAAEVARRMSADPEYATQVRCLPTAEFKAIPWTCAVHGRILVAKAQARELRTRRGPER